MKTKNTLFERILLYSVALIYLQTLYFKFAGAEEARFIFTAMGMEPWGRYLIGGAEFIIAVMLIYPGTALFGSSLSVLLMAAAIIGHTLFIGIEVMGDGGLLFGMALYNAIVGIYILIVRRNVVAERLRRFYSSK
jgi:hypothetical protein